MCRLRERNNRSVRKGHYLRLEFSRVPATAKNHLTFIKLSDIQMPAQSDFSGDNVSTTVIGTGLRDRSKIDAFGLITGQVGYAWNNVLLYVKGGGAVVSDRYRSSDVVTGLEFDRASETRWGGTVGAGVEFAFAPNWTVGFEYDHIFLGHRNVGFTGSGNFVLAPLGAATRTDRIGQDVDIGLVRVNYRWGGPVIAKY
jgi:outer membrane immunogenic protein